MLVELSTQKDQSQSYGSPKLANEEMATKCLLAISSPKPLLFRSHLHNSQVVKKDIFVQSSWLTNKTSFHQ